MSVTVMCLAIYVSVIADMSTKSYHNCQPSVNHIMCIPVMQYRFTLVMESSSRIAHHTTLSVSYWIDFLLYSVAKKSLAEILISEHARMCSKIQREACHLTLIL